MAPPPADLSKSSAAIPASRHGSAATSIWVKIIRIVLHFQKEIIEETAPLLRHQLCLERAREMAVGNLAWYFDLATTESIYSLTPTVYFIRLEAEKMDFKSAQLIIRRLQSCI